LFSLDASTGQSAPIGGPFTLGNPGSEVGILFLARANGGALIGLSGAPNVTAANVYSIDEQTGVATQVHDLQFGPVAPAGAAIDPTDGLLYYINTAGIVPVPVLIKVDLVSGQETFVGNIGLNNSEPVHGLIFDGTGQLYGLNQTQNALWNIDKTNPGNSQQVGAGLGAGLNLSSGASLAVDPGSGTVFGYEAANQRVFTVDLNGGGAVVVSTAGAGVLFSGIAGKAPPVCLGSARTYGQGCTGSGGFTPSMSLSGCAEVGQSVTLNIDEGIGGGLTLILVGNVQASIPATPNCNVLVSPFNPLPLFNLSGGGAGPGNGSINIGGVIQPSAAGSTSTLQALIQDAGVSRGYSATNGLELIIP